MTEPIPGSAPAIAETNSPALVRRKISLPNATVGRDYQAQVVFGSGPSVVIVEPSANGMEGTGLNFDPSTCTLFGVPGLAGDFSFSFRAVLETGAHGRGQNIELTGTITVNPDPRSLWRNVASDAAGRYAKPDEDKEVLVKGEIVAVAASRRGRSHAHEGKYRDDDFGIRHLVSSGWWLLAVADGAGSAPWSRRGSQIAISETLAKLEELLSVHANNEFLDAIKQLKLGDADSSNRVSRGLYEILVRAAYAGAIAIQLEATQQGEAARSFASTLLLTLYRRIDDAHFFAGFGIGDGGIALLRLDDDEVVPLNVPDAGEFAGQTRFLSTTEFASAESSMNRLHFRLVDRFTALVLMTDGVTDPKLESDDKLGDVLRWRELWERDLAPAVNFANGDADVTTRMLAWLDFYTANNHDDRTIAVLLPATI